MRSTTAHQFCCLLPAPYRLSRAPYSLVRTRRGGPARPRAQRKRALRRPWGLRPRGTLRTRLRRALHPYAARRFCARKTVTIPTLHAVSHYGARTQFFYFSGIRPPDAFTFARAGPAPSLASMAAGGSLGGRRPGPLEGLRPQTTDLRLQGYARCVQDTGDTFGSASRPRGRVRVLPPLPRRERPVRRTG